MSSYPHSEPLENTVIEPSPDYFAGIRIRSAMAGMANVMRGVDQALTAKAFVALDWWLMNGWLMVAIDRYSDRVETIARGWDKQESDRNLTSEQWSDKVREGVAKLDTKSRGQVVHCQSAEDDE